MAKFGVLWVKDYALANITALDEARKSASYLRHVLKGSNEYAYGDGAAFPDPPLTCTPTLPPPPMALSESVLAQPASGHEAAESASLFYYAGHGEPGGLRMNLPTSNPAYLVQPSEVQWGQDKLRWVCLDACDQLTQTGVALRWQSSFKGIRGIFGWHGQPSPRPTRGLLLGWFLNEKERFTDAWSRACEESEEEFPSWASLRQQKTSAGAVEDVWPSTGAAPTAITQGSGFIYVRAGASEPAPTFSSDAPAVFDGDFGLPDPPPLFPWNGLSEAAVKERAKLYAASLGWTRTSSTAYEVCDELGTYWHRVRLKVKDTADGTKGTLDIYPMTGAIRWVRAGWSVGGPKTIVATDVWSSAVTTVELLNAANAFLHAHALRRDLAPADESKNVSMVTLIERFGAAGESTEGPAIIARHVQFKSSAYVGPMSRMVVTLAKGCLPVACYRALPCQTTMMALAAHLTETEAREALRRHLTQRGEDPALAFTFPVERARYVGSPSLRQGPPLPVYTFHGSLNVGRDARQPHLFHVLARRITPPDHQRYAAPLLQSLILP